VVKKERFEQGLTLEQYVDQMSINRERFVKLIEGRPGIEMRLFPRDANLDLMDQYLKKGLYRSIPVFAFFDEHMNEVARFIETRPR